MLKGEPLYNVDCHSPHGIPIVQYIDHKSDGVPSEDAGISALSASKLGVAKSFYMLEDVDFACGRELLKPLKYGPSGTGSENVWLYTTCCNTLCVTDSGKKMPQPWRSFNRNAIRKPDGTPYMPKEEVVNGNCKDNEKFEEIPQPRENGLPPGVFDQLAAVWSDQLPPEEQDIHAGKWAPGGDDPLCFYMDADFVEEFAVALVGLENALGEFMERERQRAKDEAAAKKKAEEEAAAKKAAEEEAARILAEKTALVEGNPSQAAALYDKGMTFDEVYEELKKMFAPKEEEKVEKKEGADDLVDMLAAQLQTEALNPDLQIIKAPQYDADEITRKAKEIADQAFKRYDADGSGTIEKEELFDMCLAVGQVAQPGADEAAQRKYLEHQWALADTNGDGTVDFDEFVEFYVCTLEALAAEEAARHAFNRYDVDGSNALEKHELFQALFDLDMVPGNDQYEKRNYLEEQFMLADTNGDGVVDFPEFVAFYTMSLHDSRKCDVVFERRRKNKKVREERAKRALAYVQPESILEAAQANSLVLLSAKWLLARAGYTSKDIERRGVKKTTYTKDASKTVTPLPPRQTLEVEDPKAYLPYESLTASYDGYQGICKAGGKSFEASSVSALPVILAYACWRAIPMPTLRARRCQRSRRTSQE